MDVLPSEKVLRLAGPDLVRVSVFNPLIGTESWDGYLANIDVSDLSENYALGLVPPPRSENVMDKVMRQRN